MSYHFITNNFLPLVKDITCHTLHELSFYYQRIFTVSQKTSRVTCAVRAFFWLIRKKNSDDRSSRSEFGRPGPTWRSCNLCRTFSIWLRSRRWEGRGYHYKMSSDLRRLRPNLHRLRTLRFGSTFFVEEYASG
jgi:hypothetical protein